MIEIHEDDTPWEVACKLINTERVADTFFGKRVMPVFEPPELRRIGEHLIHYVDTECKEVEQENE